MEGCEHNWVFQETRAKESLKLHLGTKKEGEAFWQSKYGPAKGTSTLRGWVNDCYKILKRLDPSTPYFTPHSFRHTFLQNATDGTHYICQKIGRSLTMEEAQMIAHHNSIDMTKSYLKPRDGEIIFGLFGINIE